VQFRSSAAPADRRTTTVTGAPQKPDMTIRGGCPSRRRKTPRPERCTMTNSDCPKNDHERDSSPSWPAMPPLHRAVGTGRDWRSFFAPREAGLGPSLHSLQCSIIPAFGVKAAMEGGATGREPGPPFNLRFPIPHLAPSHSEACSEIRFVGPRDGPFVCAVDSMRVFDTDLFRQYGQAASIGYGRRPGHRENAVILDRETACGRERSTNAFCRGRRCRSGRRWSGLR
jgi:hypothetical protein